MSAIIFLLFVIQRQVVCDERSLNIDDDVKHATDDAMKVRMVVGTAVSAEKAAESAKVKEESLKAAMDATAVADTAEAAGKPGDVDTAACWRQASESFQKAADDAQVLTAGEVVTQAMVDKDDAIAMDMVKAGEAVMKSGGTATLTSCLAAAHLLQDKEACEDISKWCSADWVERGYCIHTYEDWMHKN